MSEKTDDPRCEAAEYAGPSRADVLFHAGFVTSMILRYLPADYQHAADPTVHPQLKEGYREALIVLSRGCLQLRRLSGLGD